MSGAARTGFDWHLKEMGEKKEHGSEKNMESGKVGRPAAGRVFASNCKHPPNFILTSLICSTSKQDPNAP